MQALFSGSRRLPAAGCRSRARRGASSRSTSQPAPRQRAVCVMPRALYHNPGPGRPQAGQDAQDAVKRVLELVVRQDRQCLVDYLNNANLTDVPTLRLPGDVEEHVVVFEDVIANMLMQPPSKHFLDSYGVRHLVLTPPSSFQVLSGLLLGPDKYLQRVAAVSPSGEECVLNVTMTASMPPPLASPLPPQQETPAMTPLSSVDDCTSSNSSSSTPAAATEGPGSSGVKPVWRLSCVRGEPAVRGDGLEGPSPELPPEVVVEQQLAAMQRRDFAAAFSFLSPGSKKVVGGEAQFTANVKKHRRYSALQGHIAATSVRRCQTSNSMFLEIVSVTSVSGIRFVFCYILSRQVDEGPSKDCWLIEYIKVVEDAKLLAAVDLSTSAASNPNLNPNPNGSKGRKDNNKGKEER